MTLFSRTAFSRLARLRHCLVLALVLGLGLVPAHGVLRAEPLPMLFIWDEMTADEMRELAEKPYSYAKADAPKGGTLRLTAVGTFDNFNPFSPRGLPAAWLRLTYETLGVDADLGNGAVRGLLAESFEVAPDRSSLKVRLRDEARFSNGESVTAEDVRFTFEALMKDGSPTYRNYYANVERVDVLDAKTAVFLFSEKNNRELPLIVTQLPVVPKSFWEERDFSAPQAEIMPGSGPYRLARFEMGNTVVYERNPDWWGRALPVNQGLYNFDFIRVDYYRSQDVAREAFLAGSSDYFAERTIRNWISGYDTPAVRDGRLLKEEIPQNRPQGMTGFFFNTRREVFADKRVRRAISLCFNFEWTNRTLFHDAYTRCTSYFTNSAFEAPEVPGEDEKAFLGRWKDRLAPEVFGPLPGFPPTGAQGLPRERLDEILRLFAEAGWSLKNGRMVNERGEQLAFTLTLVSPTMQRVAMPFRKNLERVGVKMDIELPDQTQYVTRVRSFDYDMILSTVRQGNNPGNEQRYFWGSKAADANGSRNYAGIRDQVVDEIVEAIVEAPNRTTQETAVRALDRVLLHGHYVLPGWYAKTLFSARWAERVERPEKSPREGINLLSWYMGKGQERGADAGAGAGTAKDGEKR